MVSLECAIDNVSLESNHCVEDILWEKMPPGTGMLGLDHMSKSRSVWNRADSIFIR
jgi:hypothetical protein